MQCLRIVGVWARYFINKSFMQHLHIAGLWTRHPYKKELHATHLHHWYVSPELQQIKSIKTRLLPLSCLVVASVLNNNALLFDDKSSSTFKLVVASVTNEFSKGVTIGSSTKQCHVLNDDPAIECLCSFRSQWLELLFGSKLLCWHSNEASKCNPSFSWLMCLFQIKMICAVYSKWLSAGTTLSSIQPLLTTALSSWLSSQILICCVLREHEHPQPTSTIPKYLFTSAKIADCFVRENGNGM